MGNQLAVLTHTNRGQEIILEEDCHIFNYEVAVWPLAGVWLNCLREGWRIGCRGSGGQHKDR